LFFVGNTNADVKISLLSLLFWEQSFKRWEIPMIPRLELLISRIIGKWVFDPGISFFLILILVFVSRMLVRALSPRYQVWTARIFTFFTFLATLSSSFLTTAECSPGEDSTAEASASGSGTEALELERSAMEAKIKHFLGSYSNVRAPKQTLFDGLKEELKLGSATQADLEKLTSIMEQLLRDNKFASPGEAASQLVIDYSNYYQTKYNKSLW
jgi:phosphate/sulfate permease